MGQHDESREMTSESAAVRCLLVSAITHPPQHFIFCHHVGILIVVGGVRVRGSGHDGGIDGALRPHTNVTDDRSTVSARPNMRSQRYWSAQRQAASACTSVAALTWLDMTVSGGSAARADDANSPKGRGQAEPTDEAAGGGRATRFECAGCGGRCCADSTATARTAMGTRAR